MISEKNKWWERRTPRAVDYLKLWKENPRFDTAESQSRIKLADFAEEIISEPRSGPQFSDMTLSGRSVLIVPNNTGTDYD